MSRRVYFMQHISYIEDFKQWKEEFSFYVNITIRFSETDMFGHVNNVSPFIYFEEARIKYMKYLGLFTNLTNPESVPVVADLQCDYHRQIFFGETIKLYVKINSIGNSSLDLHYLAINESDEVCLTGRGRLVNVNPKTGKPMNLSESIKQKLMVK